MKNYINKDVVSMREAVQSVKSGDTIWFSGSDAAAQSLAQALAERRNWLKNITVISAVPLAGSAAEELTQAGDIKLMDSGEAIAATYKNCPHEFLRASSTVVRLICRELKINMVIAEVSYPDAGGSCNLSGAGRALTKGVTGWWAVRKRIAVLNPELEAGAGRPANARLPFNSFNLVCDIGSCQGRYRLA